VSRRTLGIGLAATLLAGCSLLVPQGIQTTIPAADGNRALPVTVVDHAAIVAGVGPARAAAPQDWGRGEVQSVGGRDDAVLVSWVGGSCDDRAIITIDPDGDRYTVTVKAQSSAMGCDAAGHFRSVVLTLTRPTGADAFSMS
jgi:hypothetical protein